MRILSLAIGAFVLLLMTVPALAHHKPGHTGGPGTTVSSECETGLTETGGVGKPETPGKPEGVGQGAGTNCVGGNPEHPGGPGGGVGLQSGSGDNDGGDNGGHKAGM